MTMFIAIHTQRTRSKTRTRFTLGEIVIPRLTLRAVPSDDPRQTGALTPDVVAREG